MNTFVDQLVFSKLCCASNRSGQYLRQFHTHLSCSPFLFAVPTPPLCKWRLSTLAPEQHEGEILSYIGFQFLQQLEAMAGCMNGNRFPKRADIVDHVAQKAAMSLPESAKVSKPQTCISAPVLTILTDIHRPVLVVPNIALRQRDCQRGKITFWYSQSWNNALDLVQLSHS